MSSRRSCRARESDLCIKVAAGEPLQANSLLMRSLCDSADGLPAAADVWDVSGLLLDGQPFSRETVSCWLSCAHSLLHGAGELGPQDIQQLSTVTGLTQVLAFADAVGSVKGLITAACSQLQQLKFVVQLPEQELELHVASHYYCIERVPDDQMMDSWSDRLVQSSLREPDTNISSHLEWPQRIDLQQQVALQAGQLLRLAHVLRLHPLLDILHQFVMLHADRLLWDSHNNSVAGLVFSDAVLAAALGSSTLSKEAYISSVLSQPCTLTPCKYGCHTGLLKPSQVPVDDARTRLFKLDAELLRDFAGGRAGDTVHVELDVFGEVSPSGGSMYLRSMVNTSAAVLWLPVQLLLGGTFPDAASLEKFLKVDPPVDQSAD